MQIAVVIPSKTISNLVPCLRAVQENEPDARIIVVDDGLPDTPSISGGFILGKKPFIFSRNANIGLRYSFRWFEADTAVLLNDDAILETPGGFTAMAEAQRANPEFGLISAACNNVGNTNQWPKKTPLAIRTEARTLAFVCVMIPRSTWEAVGPLDERFTAYGWEDNDYCRRVREAGMKLGIFDGCFVDHASLKSTFRGAANAAGDIEPGRKIYVEKWGSVA